MGGHLLSDFQPAAGELLKPGVPPTCNGRSENERQNLGDRAAHEQDGGERRPPSSESDRTLSCVIVEELRPV